MQLLFKSSQPLATDLLKKGSVFFPSIANLSRDFATNRISHAYHPHVVVGCIKFRKQREADYILQPVLLRLCLWRTGSMQWAEHLFGWAGKWFRATWMWNNGIFNEIQRLFWFWIRNGRFFHWTVSLTHWFFAHLGT